MPIQDDTVAQLQLISGHAGWRFERRRFIAYQIPSASGISKQITKLLAGIANREGMNDIDGEYNIPFLPPGGGEQILQDSVSIGEDSIDPEKLRQRIAEATAGRFISS